MVLIVKMCFLPAQPLPIVLTPTSETHQAVAPRLARLPRQHPPAQLGQAASSTSQGSIEPGQVAGAIK